MIRTLEFYDYIEQNNFRAGGSGSYSVNVSDDEDNIITIENDGGLLAKIGLKLDEDGVLSLLDVARGEKTIASVEFPDAKYITDVRASGGTIFMDYETLGGDTDTLTIDVEDLVTVYQAGPGLYMDEYIDESGKTTTTFGIKISSGSSNVLGVSDDGLSFSGDVFVTEEELEQALSGIPTSSAISLIWEAIGEFPYVDESIDERLKALSGAVETERTKRALNDGKLADEIAKEASARTDYDAYLKELIDEISGDTSGNTGVWDAINEISGSTSGNPGENLWDAIGKISGDTSLWEAVTEISGVTSGRSDNIWEVISAISGTNIWDIIKNETDIDEENIWNALKKEQVERIAGDNYISGIVDTLSGYAYNDLTDRIAAEEVRADAAEQAISGKLTTEVSRLDGVDDFIKLKLNELSAETIDYKNALSGAIDTERAERIAADNALQTAIDAEMNRAIAKEGELQDAIDAEEARAKAEEMALSGSVQDIAQALRDEKEAREDGDESLEFRINDLPNQWEAADDQKENEIKAFVSGYYATKAYVNEKVYDDCEAAKNAAIADSKMYTDEKATETLISAQTYTDSQINLVRDGITLNATKINAISNLRGVTGDDTSNYDDSGNGILDVLHREFHEYVDEHQGEGAIKEIIYEDGKLILVYDTPEGEKRTEIPVSDLVDLTDYYKKEEIDEELLNYYTKEQTSGSTELEEEFNKKVNATWLDEKLGSAFTGENSAVTVTDVIIDDEKVIAAALNDLDGRKMDLSAYTPTDLTDYYKKEEIDNKIDDLVDGADSDYNTLGKTEGKIVDLSEKLGYDDNKTLVTNNDREVAFGKYNLSNTGDDSSEKTIFSIGNGTDENNRSNALEVRENGDVYLWVEGEYMNINILLGMLSHETY